MWAYTVRYGRDVDAEIEGPTLKTLMLNELGALKEYQDWHYTLHCWRTRDQKEVDFVLYGGRVLFAIEVLRSALDDVAEPQNDPSD